MGKKRLCLNCGAPLYGRPDKLFCCDRCKDTWHNARRGLVRRSRTSVLGILEHNYSILYCFLNAEASIWPLSLAESLGFKKDYFTRLASYARRETVCECFNIRYRVSKTKIWGIETIGAPGGSVAQISSPSRS